MLEIEDIVADLRAYGAGRDVEVEGVSSKLTALQNKYDTHMATHQPPPASTLFGADAVGTSLAGQRVVVTKWGPGIAVRQFFRDFTQVAPHYPDVAVVHASWKPQSVSAITEAAVRAATANLLPGDCVEVWHESDKKVRDGLYSHTEALARKNKFYDVVKKVRPDLVVVNTLTGWEADPNNKTTRGNIDKWAEVKADLLGLDCDGVHGWPYPNYDGEIATAQAFLAKFPAYSGWCVPEFGTSRNTNNDPSGTVRAAWFTEYGTKFENADALHVCAYEYEKWTPGNALTTTAEVSAWKGMIA